MADSVEEKSGFLRMYMSNHPDTLVAYAKWYGKVKEAISSAEMVSISTKSMTLACTLKDKSKKNVVVVFDPPLSGYEDVKPRLLEMKALAQEGLGMIKLPQLTTFHIPTQSAIISGTVVLFFWYLWLTPMSSTSSWFTVGHLGRQYLGNTIIKIVAGTILGFHILESLYSLNLCRKHRTGFVLGAKYVLATFVSGYPIWSSMRKSIQVARINSVMKIE